MDSVDQDDPTWFQPSYTYTHARTRTHAKVHTNILHRITFKETIVQWPLVSVPGVKGELGLFTTIKSMKQDRNHALAYQPYLSYAHIYLQWLATIIPVYNIQVD